MKQLKGFLFKDKKGYSAMQNIHWSKNDLLAIKCHPTGTLATPCVSELGEALHFADWVDPRVREPLRHYWLHKLCSQNMDPLQIVS